MPVKSIEIGRNAIRLTFLVGDSRKGLDNQSGAEIIPECYTLRRRKPVIGMGLASLAHRDPQALLEAIGQLKTMGEQAENRSGRFIFNAIKRLESVSVAIYWE